RGQRGIELAGAVPDLDIGFLDDLLGEILSAQDTENDAKEFRARGGVKALESGLIPLRNRGNQPDQLCRRQHSHSPNRDPPRRRTGSAAIPVAYPALYEPPSRWFIDPGQ